MNARLIVLALVIGCLVMGFATDVSAQAATKSAPSRGPREGIKVHGDWVIEVRNPDGTLATRREFKNALDSTGSGFLSKILGRQRTPGDWDIQVWGPCIDTTLAGICFLVESTNPFAAGQSNFFGTLTVATDDSDRLVLAGTATAQRDAEISVVMTDLITCPRTVAPTACPGSTVDLVGGLMTVRAFFGSDRTPVRAGQIIQVTVTISFS